MGLCGRLGLITVVSADRCEGGCAFGCLCDVLRLITVVLSDRYEGGCASCWPLWQVGVHNGDFD